MQNDHPYFRAMASAPIPPSYIAWSNPGNYWSHCLKCSISLWWEHSKSLFSSFSNTQDVLMNRSPHSMPWNRGPGPPSHLTLTLLPKANLSPTLSNPIQPQANIVLDFAFRKPMFKESTSEWARAERVCFKLVSLNKVTVHLYCCTGFLYYAFRNKPYQIYQFVIFIPDMTYRLGLKQKSDRVNTWRRSGYTNTILNVLVGVQRASPCYLQHCLLWGVGNNRRIPELLTKYTCRFYVINIKILSWRIIIKWVCSCSFKAT